MKVDETGIYPKSWREFIGQDLAKAQIQLKAQSAKRRRAPMPHTLLSHPDGGMGKTALAKLAAAEMNTEVIEISGRLPLQGARRLFAKIKPRTVIFWDEFHQSVAGGKHSAEWMLHLMQDGYLLGPFGPEPVPPVTILGATTDEGQLPKTILGRMFRPPLLPYTVDEAARIVGVMAGQILVPEGLPRPSRRNALTLAAAGNCNPRAIRQLVCTLRDVGVVHPGTVSGRHYSLDLVFQFHGLTPDGLDHKAQEYLRVLLNEFSGGAGAAALRDRLMQADLAEVERVLMDKGYIGKTGRGRTLTAAGIVRAEELAA